MPIFLLLILSTFHAKANLILNQDQCQAVDIRDVNPGLREHFSTPRDQDSIGWCYGFAAADLLTAKLGTPVSAIHMSALYNRNIDRNFFLRTGHDIFQALRGNPMETYEGGTIGRSLKEALRNGTVCTEEQLPFDANYFGGTRGDLLDLETLRTRVRETPDEERACEMVESLRPDGIFGNSDFSQISEVLGRGRLNGGLEAIVSAACKESPLSVGDFKVRSKNKPRRRNGRPGREYVDAIGTALAAGKPVGISYNPRRVTGSDGAHASSVIARRWLNGKCQYKVRNSWGAICPYVTGIECDEPEGSFWVNDEDFHEMVRSITYLE